MKTRPWEPLPKMSTYDMNWRILTNICTAFDQQQQQRRYYFS